MRKNFVVNRGKSRQWQKRGGEVGIKAGALSRYHGGKEYDYRCVIGKGIVGEGKREARI